MTGASHANPDAATRRLSTLLDHPAVAALEALGPEREPLLVGGVLRDCLLGREVRDFDAVVAAGGAAGARALAERLGSRPIRLGGDRFAAFRLETPEFRIDLWDRGGMSLEDDLLRRDLTVNAMAFRLRPPELLDLCGGLDDLDRRVLRATSDGVFEDDPLRVLRLVRFSVELPGFVVDPSTFRLARRAAAGLGRVAAERIREELEVTLAAPAGGAAPRLLAELGLYRDLFGGAIESDELEAVCRRLERLDSASALLETGLRAGAVDRGAAALAAIFATLPEPADRLEATRRRRWLSNRRARSVARLLERRELPAGDAARRWFLHGCGELWPTAAAYLTSALGEAAARSALEALAELARADAAAIFAPRPLLDGHEIAALLELEPGPRLGELTGELRRAQIEGRVSTRAAAVEWLRQRPGGRER